MIRTIRFLMCLAVCVVLATLFGRPLKARARAADGPIDRPFAVVTVAGRQLPALLGVPIDRLRVYRLGPAGMLPIPFQVDQKNERGRLLFPLGPEPDRVRPDEPLAPQDELVFMAFDAGPVLSSEALKGFPRPSHRVRLADPARGAEGEVVVFADDGRFRLSEADYVRFDEPADRTHGLSYSIGGQPGRPAIADYLAPHQTGRSVNILDRMKMRGEADLLLGLIHLRRTEEDLVSGLRAYLDGPVRVVRWVDYALRAIWNIRTPTVRREMPAYAHHVEFPNEMRVPFKMSTVFSDMELVSGFDFRPEMGTARMYTDDFSDPVVIDGKMSEREKELGQYYPLWFVVDGECGCMMFYIVMNDALKRIGVEATLHYTDDLTRPDPPEASPGQYGQTLYRMRNVLEIPRGNHFFNVIFYFPPECRAGMEGDALVEWNDPLGVQVLP